MENGLAPDYLAELILPRVGNETSYTLRNADNLRQIHASFRSNEVNHKRHFIKIPFINKGVEFIDLHSIFKDNSVISSIPNYFNNSETPIICYKYNKPIRSTIFNFNKIVNDLDIDSNTPAS